MNSEENIQRKKKIGKLMIKFSIPCIISMLVNSLYNIVDQVFIGWGVGYLGNGATNIVFPINIICLAFALMLGDGTSAYLSLKLGEKKPDEAKRGVANGILLSIILSLIFFLIIIVTLPILLNLFGCTPALRPYAINYGYIITIGLPFMMIGTSLNGVIRADGSPKYSMVSMVAGAILNTILDPLFIFAFHWGVKGAAAATAISQVISFLMNILYLRRFKSIDLKRNDFKLKTKTIYRILSLGISSFITQMSFVLLIAVENNMLKKVGSNSEYGADIPITVLGIVMKINQILNSIILGIAVGSQPIIGYNYGAGRYDRVKETLKKVLIISFTVGTIGFILFQAIPDKLIAIFGSGNQKYIDFACLSFRIYLMLCMLNAIQVPAGIFFQAIGKSIISAILSISRQIALLIPAMIILGNIFGIIGVLAAGPVADGIAFLLAAIALSLEVRRLGKNKQQSQALIDDTSTDNILKKHTVITIAREYGSGGRYVARLIADKLGIKFYDKDFITKVAEETGLSENYIEENEQKRGALATLEQDGVTGLSGKDELFIKESEIIKKIAKEESCVIVGRCSDYVLKDDEDTVKVFIYSNDNDKKVRASQYYKLDPNKAEKEIKKIDKQRANHYKYYTGREWKDYTNYDICLNSDTYGVEKTADIICEIVKKR